MGGRCCPPVILNKTSLQPALTSAMAYQQTLPMVVPTPDAVVTVLREVKQVYPTGSAPYELRMQLQGSTKGSQEETCGGLAMCDKIRRGRGTSDVSPTEYKPF